MLNLFILTKLHKLGSNILLISIIMPSLYMIKPRLRELNMFAKVSYDLESESIHHVLRVQGLYDFVMWKFSKSFKNTTTYQS